MKNNDRMSLVLWRWQRRSAILLVPLLIFHVIYQYFVIGMDDISFATVTDRLEVAGFLIVDLALLLTVALHAFTGVRSIAVDYTGSLAGIRALTALLGVLCVATVVYAIAALAAFL